MRMCSEKKITSLVPKWCTICLWCWGIYHKNSLEYVFYNSFLICLMLGLKKKIHMDELKFQKMFLRAELNRTKNKKVLADGLNWLSYFEKKKFRFRKKVFWGSDTNTEIGPWFQSHTTCDSLAYIRKVWDLQGISTILLLLCGQIKALERKVHTNGLLYSCYTLNSSYYKLLEGPELEILILNQIDGATICTSLRKVENFEKIIISEIRKEGK